MVRMLDVIGSSDGLGLQSCAELFADGGQGPSVRRSPMLTRYVREQLALGSGANAAARRQR
jgi:hypothetical protein